MLQSHRMKTGVDACLPTAGKQLSRRFLKDGFCIGKTNVFDGAFWRNEAIGAGFSSVHLNG